MGLDLRHNVERVIEDVEDVKTDLNTKLRNRLRMVMRSVMETAIAHVSTDAQWRGNLLASIRSHGVDLQQDEDGFQVTVGTDASIAPYGAFVEFGTGKKAEQSGPGSANFPPFATGDAVPPGYPFQSPEFVTRDLINDITEWVKTKPIIPREADSPEEVGVMIAHEIVANGTYAHPFLRPAFFQHELQIRQAARNAVKSATR